MPKFKNSFGGTTKSDPEEDGLLDEIENETNEEIVSLSPMYDFVFRIWMSDKIVCGEFLEAVLGRKVEILAIEAQTDIIEALPGLRGIRLDIKVIGKDHEGLKKDKGKEIESIEIYDIESQRIHYADNRERCVFYASRLLSTQLKAGDHFSKLNRTTIVFVNMESLERDEFLQSASLRFDNKPEEVYYDKLQIVELNLDKLQGFQDELYQKDNLSGNSREDKLDFFASFCLIGDDEKAFKGFCEERKFDCDALLNKLFSAFHLMRNDKEIKEKAKEYVRKYGEVKEATTMRLSDQIRKEGIEKGIEKGIEIFVQEMQEEGISDSRILIKLQKRYVLSEEQAKDYLCKFSRLLH